MNDPAVLQPYGSELGRTWLATGADRRVVEQTGTLAFFDVSGFTRLSERLARLGRLGAETIAEIVDRLYTGLIDPVLDTGGDVLQFSGDAILAWWPDDRADAVAAAHAAIAMQAFVAGAGRVETELGAVRLRMSVGMHHDHFTFALLGGEQRVVLALGSATTRMLELEKRAVAGQVLVSEALAGRLPRGLTRRLGDAVALRRRPLDASAAAGVQLGPVPGARATDAALVPRTLRDALGDPTLRAEHRGLVLGFVGVRDVDDALAAAPAATMAALAGFVDRLEAVANELELTWIGLDAFPGGFDAFLVAGAPRASEDDTDRMLLAVRRVLDGRGELAVAAGVNRGRAFVGPVGHPRRRTYGVTGDATNLAARLMAHAQIGTLLTTPATLATARQRWDHEPVAPFAAKGKRAPVEAVAVDRPVGYAAAHVDLALVGRTAERTRVLTPIRRLARDRRGGAVLVRGAAGLGKSRLVTEARAAAHDQQLVWHWLAAQPLDAATPFAPWRPLLRWLFGAGAVTSRAETGTALLDVVARRVPQLTPWTPLLAAVADASVPSTPAVERLDPRFRRERLHDAVVELLATLRPAGFVLAAEDLHFFDDASRALLAHVAAVAGDRAWVVLATTRVDERVALDEWADAEIVELGALDEAAGVELLHAAAAALGRPLAAHTSRRLAARAAGNPLFLRELVTAIGAGDDLDALPDSVERLLAARIDRLAPAPRALLREAAALGATVDVRLLAEVLGRPVVWTGLAEFVEAGGVGEMRFVHDLVRQAAYEGLAYRRRTELHGRALDAAVAHPDASRSMLAWHAIRARRWADAWEWCRAAGGEASERAAPVEAAAHLRDALDAGRRADVPAAELARVAEQLGEVEFLLGAPEAGSHFDLARRASPDPVTRARCARRRGDLAERDGAYPAALRWYSRAATPARAAGPAGEPEVARAVAAAAATLVLQGRSAECERRGVAAYERARACGDDRCVGEAAAVLDAAARWQRPSRRTPWLAIAREHFARVGDDRGLAYLELNTAGWDHLAGDPAGALTSFVAATERFTAIGHVVGAALADNNHAEALVDLDRFGEAEVLLDRAERELAAAGYRGAVPLVRSARARIAVRRGDDVAAALAELEVARREFAELGEDGFVVDTDLRILEGLVALGRDDEAKALADRLEPITSAPEHLVPYELQRRRLRAEVVGPDEAARDLAAARELAEREGHALERARLAEVAARRGVPGG